MPESSLEGQVVVITGASAGIGAAAARALQGLGASLAIVGRDPDKTRAVAAETGATPFVADFARLADVRKLATALQDRYDRIDVLVNNAGLFARKRELTEDGHELTFQVNHLAPFLLTNLLAERLGGSSRVITTSSRAQMMGHVERDDLEWARRRFSGFRVYGTTKLENVLFTNELARRSAGSGVAAVSFHPGSVRSEFGRRGGLGVSLVYRTPISRIALISPEEGADTLVWLASSQPGVDWRSGGYYARRQPGRTHLQASDEELAGWLWERSAELVGLS